MSLKANVVELFSSIQGEGALVGCRQIFVRFFSCNLECAYCDTPRSIEEVRGCRVERVAGKGEFYELANPVDAETLSGIISSLETFAGLHHSISLTGGEPLLQSSFLSEWLPELRQRFKIHLETNGTLCRELEDVIESVDMISMDIKLPLTARIEPEWKRHREFIRLASQKELFVKVVVSAETTEEGFMHAVDLVASEGKDIPLVIQPVTPFGPVMDRVDGGRLLELHEMASRSLNDVRVIPQSHKMMGLL